MKNTHVTEEGFKKMIEELSFLRSVERPRISTLIQDARENGDVSESVEYDSAKEAQNMLEMKISKLEEMISNAKVINKNQIDTSKVSALTTVVLKTSNGNCKYTIVPENEVNVREGKISLNSPIGKALIGKIVGDKIQVSVPSGNITMEILEILA